MSRPGETAELDRDRREEFCRRVLESLSDIIEGEAPEHFCREVDRVLGDCRPYLAFRSTLERTIQLTRELGEAEAVSEPSEDTFRRCVEKVRDSLQDEPAG